MLMEAYKELEDVVGPENISHDPAILDGYAFQPVENRSPPWAFRPEFVVLPANTEEVQKIVKLCNKYKIKFKALSAAGWGAWSAPGSEGVGMVDLRRMNRILEIDERNMYAVIEPNVNWAQLQAEIMKKGMNCNIIGAGSHASPLVSCTSAWGMGWNSLYHGYNGRNVLGVEWVLPTGEILRLGSLGTGAGWFCGDGPGPSLRGLMRGFVGALGGLGIFTKCAIKLYNWPGPREPHREWKLDGILRDLKGEVPKNFKSYLLVLPNLEKYIDVGYKIVNAEIGFSLIKNAIGLLLATMMPNIFRKLPEFPVIRERLKQFQHQLQFILAANSERELEYQYKVLKKIMKETRGLLLDLGESSSRNLFSFLEDFMKATGDSTLDESEMAIQTDTIASTLWGFVRVIYPPLAFRVGGGARFVLGGEDVWDHTVLQGKMTTEIKEEFIKKGLLLDDLADNVWGLLYESDSLIGHQEQIILFNQRDPKQVEGANEFEKIAIEEALEQNIQIGNRITMDPGTNEIIGPRYCDYHLWQRKIKKFFDPNLCSDSSWYISVETEEEDK
ncbi:MAG: FAD-binding oxidoreductase [Candidatus Helarchaeota archaeon]|nr:FAD-binding oxidoreductase [Candidatus Helarchaeota archaeon]